MPQCCVWTVFSFASPLDFVWKTNQFVTLIPYWLDLKVGKYFSSKMDLCGFSALNDSKVLSTALSVGVGVINPSVCTRLTS